MSEAVFRIYGTEMSPYSVKVRSYFRCKCIPHRWVARNSVDWTPSSRLQIAEVGSMMGQGHDQTSPAGVRQLFGDDSLDLA